MSFMLIPLVETWNQSVFLYTITEFSLNVLEGTPNAWVYTILKRLSKVPMSEVNVNGATLILVSVPFKLSLMKTSWLPSNNPSTEVNLIEYVPASVQLKPSGTSSVLLNGKERH